MKRTDNWRGPAAVVAVLERLSVILAIHPAGCLSLKGGTAGGDRLSVEKEGNAQRKRKRHAVPSHPPHPTPPTALPGGVVARDR